MDTWDKLFAYLYDNFLFVGDIIWNTKLPLTDISIGYWLIFWMIIRLSIYVVNGTSSQYNDLATEVTNTPTRTYSTAAKARNFNTNRKAKKIRRANVKEKYQQMKKGKK